MYETVCKGRDTTDTVKRAPALWLKAADNHGDNDGVCVILT